MGKHIDKLNFEENLAEMRKQLDEKFEVVWAINHHYRRERGLKGFLTKWAWRFYRKGYKKSKMEL